MMKEMASRRGRVGFPKRFAEGAMLVELTKAIRTQNVLRLLGLEASNEDVQQTGSAAIQPRRSVPHPRNAHPSARDFISMAQAALRISPH
jgi:hypothetical protein